MRQPLEVASTREVPDPVVVRRGTDVGLVAMVVNSLVGRRIGPADVGRGIRRGVVRNDEFPVVVRLGQQRIDGLPQVVFPVVHGKTDGHCAHEDVTWGHKVMLLE